MLDLEPEIHSLGERLVRPANVRRHPGRALQDRGMQLTSRDPRVRAALFRLVDVAPACSGPAELAEHLDAFLDGVDDAQRPVRLVRSATHGRVSRHATGIAAGAAVRAMAGRFIAGSSPQAALGELRGLWERGVASSVDLLGEATVTREEGARYAQRCDDALVTLAQAARRWPARVLLEHDSAGALPRINLSVKVTALTPLVRAEAPERGRADAADHLRRLLRRAREVGAHLHVDMESMDSRDLVLGLVLELLSEPEFRDGPSAGIVLQAYLRDAEETLDTVLDWARTCDRPLPLTVRLVKGAYWDHETIEAAQNGWSPPVYSDKAESDRCFERTTRRLLDAYGAVRPAIASHNVRSIAHAVAYARAIGLEDSDVELQVLRGLGDDLQDALAAEGLRVRTYCPVGDLVAGMAYLVRRLLENTSNDSFLASQANGVDIAELLAAP